LKYQFLDTKNSKYDFSNSNNNFEIQIRILRSEISIFILKKKGLKYHFLVAINTFQNSNIKFHFEITIFRIEILISRFK